MQDYLFVCSDRIKDVGVMLDRKLHFHCHVDFLYSQARRTLGFNHYSTYNFSSLDSLIVLCNALIRSKQEYASVAFNNLKLTACNKIENIKCQFVLLFFFQFSV
jgi:hypothetical protein